MKPLPLANSLALTVGIFWAVCALFIWIVPGFSLSMTRTSMMGLQGMNMTGFQLDFSVFLFGLVLAVISGWVFGYVWGWLYQKLAK